MDPVILLMVVSIVTSSLMQGSVAALSQEEKLAVKRRLELINKPAIKTFVTKYGDILDCVEITKQLAFGHPFLHNHSIQMKPSTANFTKLTRSDDGRSSVLTASQFLPRYIKCPRGTVPIKRIQEEDLAMEKFSSFVKMPFPTHNVSNPNGPDVACVTAITNSLGASGVINVWAPQVKADQFSLASVYVANDDGHVTNAIFAGWMVNPSLYTNFTRLYAYWTKDSGKTTGCVNTLCPGFVQTSQKVTLGAVISPVSRHNHHQYYVEVKIRQDITTKNWWLYYEDESVGYWPKELFSTLANGAKKAWWGGEVSASSTGAPPQMGGGYMADAGYRRACHMKQLQLMSSELFPKEKDLKYAMTKPKTYSVIYGEYGDWGNYILFGGPRKL